ncbi:hypothetical protein [Microbacterium paulum]
MRSAAPIAPLSEDERAIVSRVVDPLDDLFPDPDGVIAALVADLPAPAPSRVVRVSGILAAAR